MKTRYVTAVCVVLLAMVGLTVAQQPKPAAVVPNIPPQPEPAPTKAVPTIQPAPALGEFRAVAVGGKPEDLTIDQLIEVVDGFREQKAELEKKEKAYLKVLHRKAEKQKEKIDGLGGDGHNPPPTLIPGPVAPSTSYNIPPVPTIPTGSN